MKRIIFLTIITLLAFLIAKTLPLGVEASLPPQKSPTVYGLINRESIAATMVWRYLRERLQTRFGKSPVTVALPDPVTLRPLDHAPKGLRPTQKERYATPQKPRDPKGLRPPQTAIYSTLELSAVSGWIN